MDRGPKKKIVKLTRVPWLTQEMVEIVSVEGIGQLIVWKSKFFLLEKSENPNLDHFSSLLFWIGAYSVKVVWKMM